MKKLIAMAVVLALVAGVAFAVDLGGNVIGSVDVVKGTSEEDSEIGAGGEFKHIRLEGSGEAGDGQFGGWIRVDLTGDGIFTNGVAGLAWWKPIDQLKLIIGNNPDGVWGKEGVTGWMFYQHAYDTHAVIPGNVWGWGTSYPDGIGNSGNQNMYGQFVTTRNAFFGGIGDSGLLLEIKPVDMIGINLAVPFISQNEAGNRKAGDLYTQMVAQLDVNLDFGNIAVTMKGLGDKAGADLFAYFGLSAVENLGIDIGAGFHINDADDDNKYPLGLGLGVKFTAGAFGIKFRTALSLPADDDQSFAVLADVLPFYAVSDTTRIFLSAGLGMTAPPKSAPDGAESIVGFHVNPYLEIGEEWGAKFIVGIKLWSDGHKRTTNDKTETRWEVPIALVVSF